MDTRNILCIEDNPENMQLFRRVIHSRGYNMLEATNGEQGLSIANQQDIDLILLDINLPDIDGYEIARRLRDNTNPGDTQIPIIVVTANAMKGDAEMAFEAGCNCYMSKPFDIFLLWDRIESLLEQNQNVG